MDLMDELTAPGRELQTLLRAALKGNRGATRELIAQLPRVLAAEERWLHAELRKCEVPTMHKHLQRHVEAHDRMRAVIEQFRDPGLSEEQGQALLRILDAMLVSHLRAERAMLATACDAGWLAYTSGLGRFVRRAVAPPLAFAG